MAYKIFLTALLLFLLYNTSCKEKNEEFVPLNPIIDVGENFYVQHDENNNIIYDVKKSGTGVTTLFKLLYPEFVANKAWTNKGEYIDNVVKQADGVTIVPHGATAPENYIPVKPGEQYFTKCYGVGYVGNHPFWYAPYAFFDDNDNYLGAALINTMSKSKSGVNFTIPENATKMHITMYGHQGFTLQQIVNVTDDEFDKLTMNRTKLEEEIYQNYDNYVKDKTLYDRIDKAYITIVNDDTRAPISVFADIFIEKKFPLVLATVPGALIENAEGEKETRLEVCRRVVEAGGEIIAHNGGVLTQEGFSDYNTMYQFFVQTKQDFNHYGFDVNGIILAGGTGQVTGAMESERWASSIYSYSDLYGVEYKNHDLALDSVYYHRRGGLGNFWNNIDKLKQSIDDAIAKKTWSVYYFHDGNEIKPEVMSELLDYINSKVGEQLEVVTYKQMYQKFAAKESDLLYKVSTYYVSSTGTSTDGRDINDPMSFAAANQRTYISGDTILFKKGDIFYGTFDPKINQVNDKITTISSYGEGPMPIISGYKIATEKSWFLFTTGYWKIHLKQPKNFDGLQANDDNSADIGFLEDTNGKKYFTRKNSFSEIKQQGEYYCDGTFIDMRSSDNPYQLYGVLKLATKTNLIVLHSNLKIEGLHLQGTGAHGMVGADANTKNVEIVNNVIEDVGGSFLKGSTRYGNGIEFYGTNAENILVHKNIIRNVYDVGFTIQGTAGSGKNVVVKNNIFVSNTQDSEIWESEAATGIQSYEFTENISINQGRGWGMEARPDKYVGSHILFWGYNIPNTDIYFHHNLVYNPRRLYFIEQTYGTNLFFSDHDYIKSDYNEYLMNEDTTIFRDSYNINSVDEFRKEFHKDEHSNFSLVELNEDLIDVASYTLEPKAFSMIMKYSESIRDYKNKIHQIKEITGNKK